MPRSPHFAARAIALLVTASAVAWLLRYAFEPLRLNWGDPWSDANVLTTLEYSAKYGFWKTSFTDVLDIGPLTTESYRYTHYPPLAEIIYGCVRKVVGMADIGVYRVFAIGFSAGALYFVNAYVTRLFGAVAGACATILFATNALFLQYADSIHQAPILGCSTFAALAVTARFVERGQRRDLWLLGALTFCSFLTAYDFYFFLPLAAIGTSWLLGKRLFERVTLKVTVAIAVGGALAILIKSLFVIGALGWHEFKEDFVFQFFERASTKYSVDYRFGLAKVMAARLLLYMTPLFFALVVAHIALAWRTVRTRDPRERRNAGAGALLFLVAGVPFLLVFSQLTATQVLPTQCLVPYYAIGFGVVVARLVESPARARRAAGIALGVALVAWQVVHLATFQKSLLRDEDQQAVAAYLATHDENDFVFTNLLSDGPIQYFFQRHLQPIDPNWPPGSYRGLLRRIRPDRFHIVFFEDPRSRFVDKSLFPLLAGPERSTKETPWLAIGAPPLFEATGMAAIRDFDRHARKTFSNMSTLRLQAGNISVYSVGEEELLPILRAGGLARPTERIDFSNDSANDFKLYGMRGTEPGKPYAWTTPRRHNRTLLTKTGVVWRESGRVLEAGLLLNLPAGSDYRITARVFSHLPGQTLGAMIGARELLRAEPLGAPGKARAIAFVVPKEALGADPVVTIRLPYGLSGANAEALAVDGDAVPDVGVAFESVTVERIP